MKDIIAFVLCISAVAYADLGAYNHNGCPKDATFLPHENCNQFYDCTTGILFLRDCPSGLHFNPTLKMCDWPVNANCHNNVDKKSHEKLTKNSNVDEICSSPDSEGVLVAHENCNEFYRCADGKPIHHQCAPGLLFNPTAMICDMPHNVNCTTEGLFISKKYMAATRANYTTDEEAATICATQNHFVYPFSHKNCNQFYVCSLGEPVVMSCQPTLFFNVDDGICDWQKNVKCGDRVIPGEEKKNGKVCSDANEGRLFGHQYCNQFYQCLGGELIQGSCPSGLYFNTFFGICDWPENVNCRNRLV